jgi:hypothetical protein
VAAASINIAPGNDVARAAIGATQQLDSKNFGPAPVNPALAFVMPLFTRSVMSGGRHFFRGCQMQLQ